MVFDAQKYYIFATWHKKKRGNLKKITIFAFSNNQ